MSADWKKVAAERLRKIRQLETRLESISERAAGVVARQLLRDLHARCISVSDERTRKMADEIGRCVAEALTGKRPRTDEGIADEGAEP